MHVLLKKGFVGSSQHLRLAQRSWSHPRGLQQGKKLEQDQSETEELCCHILSGKLLTRGKS